MNTLNFYDKDRALIMQFKDFLFLKTEALSLVKFKASVDFDFFHLEYTFEAEASDFDDLLLSFNKMYNREQKYITFNPLSGNIYVRVVDESGQMDVKCEVSNDLFTGKLEFKYCLDQSFIPEFIKELEEVLNLNK